MSSSPLVSLMRKLKSCFLRDSRLLAFHLIKDISASPMLIIRIWSVDFLFTAEMNKLANFIYHMWFLQTDFQISPFCVRVTSCLSHVYFVERKLLCLQDHFKFSTRHFCLFPAIFICLWIILYGVVYGWRSQKTWTLYALILGSFWFLGLCTLCGFRCAQVLEFLVV